MDQPPRPEGRVAVLIGGRRLSRLALHALLRTFRVERVIVETSRDRAAFLRRRIHRLGLMKVTSQILFAAYARIGERFARRRIDAILDASGLEDSPLHEDLIATVPSVNDQRTIAILKEAAPDVVVVVGTRIISRDVLRAIEVPFINFHTGITPAYRGVHGAYWALVNGDRERCGVTIHLIDEGIDTGAILYQALIKPTAEDNFFTYPVLQMAAGLPLLIRAANDALANRLNPRPAEGPSRLWTHPGFFEYLGNRVRRGVW